MTRTLPAIPGVLCRDSEPARLALRVIETALDHGWHDRRAEADLRRGRQALHGLRWRSTPELDADLLGHQPAALAWLTAQAIPAGFELHPYSDVIVLSGQSGVL